MEKHQICLLLFEQVPHSIILTCHPVSFHYSKIKVSNSYLWSHLPTIVLSSFRAPYIIYIYIKKNRFLKKKKKSREIIRKFCEKSWLKYTTKSKFSWVDLNLGCGISIFWDCVGCNWFLTLYICFKYPYMPFRFFEE